ncbi:hypothetical protein BVRB_4g071580 [Beta vulgaris subsp. vulgaris]|nr:hypothetical protein BVRB_4g071580 [Beta vulgaris subsp. vulgaris]
MICNTKSRNKNNEQDKLQNDRASPLVLRIEVTNLLNMLECLVRKQKT